MHSKYRILLFTDWYYPGFKAGGPIQSCKNLVEALLDHYDFFVFTSDRDLGEDKPYPNIHPDKWIKIQDGEVVYYSSPGNNSISTLLEQIKNIEPDIVYLNSMFSFRFAIIPLWLRWRGKIKMKIILAPRGMLHSGALQYKLLKKKIFIKILGLAGVPSLIDFHATDDQEAEDIKKQFPSAKSIFKAQNFTTLIKPLRKQIKKEPGVLELVFFSRISSKKNLIYALHLLSKFRFNGTINLTVAGEIEDKGYWQECLLNVQKFPPNIHFKYAGPVENKEVLDWLQNFHFLFLPTFGENFGHAIFESFIAGKPVIISDNTPWRKLEQRKLGWDIPLNDELGYVEALNNALNMNQEEYNGLSESSAIFADSYRENNQLQKSYLNLFG